MRVKDTKELGQAIKMRRKKIGYTQLDIADRTGLSASFISDVENGKETAEVGKVIQLFSVLGMNIIVEER